MSANELFEQVREYQRTIELGNTTERLLDSLDFKKVISDGLLKQGITTLALDLANCTKDSLEYVQIVREIDAISYLNVYLNNLIDQGREALPLLREAQELLNNEE